jgi:hypothetical protein
VEQGRRIPVQLYKKKAAALLPLGCGLLESVGLMVIVFQPQNIAEIRNCKDVWKRRVERCFFGIAR